MVEQTVMPFMRIQPNKKRHLIQSEGVLQILYASLRQHYLDQVQRFTPPIGASQPGLNQAPVSYSVK